MCIYTHLIRSVSQENASKYRGLQEKRRSNALASMESTIDQCVADSVKYTNYGYIENQANEKHEAIMNSRQNKGMYLSNEQYLSK